MTGQTQYHDRDAERSFLGDLMLLPQRVGEVGQTLIAEDFYEQGHAAVFTAIVALHRDGHAPTVEAVRQELGGDLKLCGGAEGLKAIADAASGNPKRSARTIADWATSRRIRNAIAQVRSDLDAGVDPGAVLDGARALLSLIDVPMGELPADLMTFDAALDTPAAQRSPWAVPGLLRVDWRAVLVAVEGQGKSVLFRQFALLAAQGIHPLSFSPMPACRTLLVDLENPLEAIAETADPIRVEARRTAGTAYQTDAAWLWRRPGGIDLRTRRDRLDFEAVIAHCRPALVCLGPLYKAYRVSAKESDEQAGGELQSVLDDLRTRYRFALLMEHHAPKGGNGVRDLMPYGTSFWLRWPEFGLKLVPDHDREGSLKVERFRHDRLKAAWPDRLDRGGRFPWTGRWPDANHF